MSASDVWVPVLAFFQIAAATVSEQASRPMTSWNEAHAVPLPIVVAGPHAEPTPVTEPASSD